MGNDLIAGFVGGVVGTTFNTPLDVVKSRIQSVAKTLGVRQKYTWAWPSLGVVAREEGFRALYKGYVADVSQLAGSEDFSILASSVGKPYSFFVYGGTEPGKWDKAEAEGRLSEDLPVNHSGLFAPVVQPTLRVGLDGYVVAALTWLAK
jgi:metal-dependent amidase/aminoacylase/carboxypeptidase family protein